MFNKKEYQKKYYIKNKNKRKEYIFKNIDKISKQKKEYRKEYNIKNKTKLNKQSKDYRIKNIDKISKREKKYSKNHPEVGRKKSRKRIARINNIIEDFSSKEWLQKLKDSFGVCPRCNKYVGIWKMTLDHIYPISLAHKDYLKTGIKRIYTIDDVEPLCKSCNSKKRDKIEK